MTIDTFLRQGAEWIAVTPLSLYLQKQGWIIIASQTLHIASVAVVFGSALVISVRLLGRISSSTPLSSLVSTLLPWMYWALAVLLVTGVEQTIAAPMRELMTWEFRWKMLLVVVTAALTVVFARSVRAHATRWDSNARPATARTFAVTWLALWIVIIYCGRFIGYAGNA